MLKNYLKIAVRNLLRYKVYSYINIFGLAIGIACCLLILLFIHDELSYDSFHEKADRIYRINTYLKFGDTELNIPVVSDMMGQLLKQDYPQVEEYTRIFIQGGDKRVKNSNHPGKNDYNLEHNVAFVDSTFFKVFTFPVVAGQTNKILNEPNTVVITESIAKKYFGIPQSGIGRTIETDDNGGTFYKVTAVIADMPENSHFRFNFLFPMASLNYNSWGNLVSMNFHTYLLLKEGTGYKELESKFEEYNDKYAMPYAKKFLQVNSKEEFEKAGNRIEHSLIPVTDIHLYSNFIQELRPAGNIRYIYIFSAVALFILLIACVNFMNLTTARSANRAREVGIRKVLGTERKDLIVQFLTESTMMAFIAVALAVIIVYHVLPYFNDLTGKELSAAMLYSPFFLLFTLLLPFLIGVTAGSYPAFFLSRFMPSEIIKGRLSKGSRSSGLRSVLVVFQFATSIILITGTIIIYTQLNYIQNKNLGYQKDQILIINDSYCLGNNIDAFKNEMLNVSGVISGTISNYLPIPSERNNSAFFKEAGMVSESGLTMQRWIIDYDYLETLGIELVEGRNFSQEFGTDSSAIILNQTAVKQLGYQDPVGKKIYTWVTGGRLIDYNIIGVVKDFHFESLRQDIGPLCFVPGGNDAVSSARSQYRSAGLISFRINTASLPSILKETLAKWESLSASLPFSYRFMDESFNEVYRTEQRIGIIALLFSSLAIIVACLGLFGLATFLAEQRTKEIGVRKVLGASIMSIIIMLSKEFIKWVVIANIIAWPLAYYFMNKWLQDFAYRIDISWWLFIAAGVAALAIALLTVSFQAFKAATANPVESLKYE
ncbi:MAG: ABC transporter permease [Ignavibacteriaceae bacterium]